MAAEKKEIKFTIDKQKALKIAKKAATEKFAMVKDEGFVFKVGTPSVPPMLATVEVTDGVIYVSGKGLGGPIAKTIYQYISDAIDDAQSQPEPSNSNSQQASSQTLSIDDQLKIVEALKGYKELLDAGIITQEEFDVKKGELLNKKTIDSLSASPTSSPDAEEKQIINETTEPEPLKESEQVEKQQEDNEDNSENNNEEETNANEESSEIQEEQLGNKNITGAIFIAVGIAAAIFMIVIFLSWISQYF